MNTPTLFDEALPAELTYPGRAGSPAAGTHEGALAGPAGAARTIAPPLLTIVAYGIPGPQGSKSFKGISRRGHAIMVESSKKVKPWRAIVAAAALEVVQCCDDPDCTDFKPGFPLDCALVGRAVFTMPKPASAPKTKVTYPMRYPDVSKLLRSTEDAISKIVWRDDARLVDYSRVAKVFPGEDPEALPAPGVRLSVWLKDGATC